MDHRTFSKTGEKISLLGFGNMRLPTVAGSDEEIDYAAAKALIDVAYRGGVNYFDTAYGYHGGGSEAFVGRALREYDRASYFLATKLPVWLVEKREDALRLFEEQLARCGVDYFDFYLLHNITPEHYDIVQRFGLYEVLDEQRRAGRIRNLGFSFHGQPPLLQQMCADHSWDFAQLQLNYIDWELQDAKRQYEILQAAGIPAIIMEPVRGGRLADLGPRANALLKQARPEKSVASWAMRWVGELENVLCVLSGMSTMPQVEDNLATFTGLQPLGTAEKQALGQAVEVFREAATVPCTRCRYCMPCPAGVDIPGMITLLNDCAFDGSAFGLRMRYEEVDPAVGAGNCVRCGACEAACPQRLPIMQLMEKINTATG